MRFFRSAALLLLVVASTACWHATINTGRTPGSQVINEDWHTNWFFGLIPGDPVDASACKTGVARIETQHSFPNMLVSYFVGIVWSPMTVTVTCAAGGSASLSPTDRVIGMHGMTREQRKAAFDEAVAIAESTRSAVFVQF